MPIRKTYCRICEAACGLEAELDKQGRLLRLRPDKQHPVSRGYVCAKGTRFHEVAAHADRLQHPLRRQPDGRYRPVSWDQAMAYFRAKVMPILTRYGPHAVGVYYGNPMIFNALGLVSLLNFTRVLGTRNVYSSFSVDCNNKFAAARLLHGGELIQPIPDLERADLALMFGTNPAVSQGSFVHLEGGALAFDRFVERGGRVIWIDPRRQESAQRWGEHLPIEPGKDVYLLLALLDELNDLASSDSQVSGLERLLAVAAAYPAARAAALTGIPADQIRLLAQEIREARATTFHLSVGVNMGPFGTLCAIALQALAYLSGNLDRPGGIVFHPLGPLLSQALHQMGIGTDPQPSRVGGLVGVFDELPAGILADEILTPGPEQIRALIIVGGNPVASIPGAARLQRALGMLETLVHVDLFANRSSATADLLLPATSWLERWDVATSTVALQQAPLLQYGGPVSKPPGEAWPERRILAEMSLVLQRPLWGSRLLARAWGRLPLDRLLTATLDGLTSAYRRRLGGVQGVPVPVPQPGRYLGQGPLTPGRQVRFWHADLDNEIARLTALAAVKDKPAAVTNGRFALTLSLISRRRRLGHNSWLHRARHDGSETAAAWLHPSDLMRLEVGEGEAVTVSCNGEMIKITAVAKKEVAPGTIVVPHGLPYVNLNDILPSGPAMIESVSGNHWMTGIPVIVQGAN